MVGQVQAPEKYITILVFRLNKELHVEVQFLFHQIVDLLMWMHSDSSIILDWDPLQEDCPENSVP